MVNDGIGQMLEIWLQPQPLSSTALDKCVLSKGKGKINCDLLC